MLRHLSFNSGLEIGHLSPGSLSASESVVV